MSVAGISGVIENPVPLPREAAPAEVAAWNSADAGRWLKARPAVWAHPLPAVAALVCALVVATDAPRLQSYLCGTSDSCEPRWWVTAHLGIAGVLVFRWLWRLPLLAAAALPLVALGVAVQSQIPVESRAAVVLAAGYALAGCLHRLRVARGQRALALAAAGPVRMALPGDVDTSGRGGSNLGCGVPVFGFALVALALSAVSSDWLMGADEWQYVAVLTLVVGLNWGGSGLAGWHGLAALRRSPSPVLRVLLRAGGGSDDRRTDVFAADDAAGGTPVFSCRTTLPTDGTLREALLYGAPCAGGELVLVTGGASGHTLKPVRPQYRAEPAAETREAGATPLRWRAGAGVRAMVLGYLAVLPLLAIGLRLYEAESRYVHGLALLVAVSIMPLVTLLNWEVVADRDGLRVTGTFSAHQVPWDRFRGVSIETHGFRVRYATDRVADVYGVLPARWLAELLPRRPRARAAVDAIRALAADPALRPAGTAARVSAPRARAAGTAAAVYCLALIVVLLLSA
ncbi:hypothetical protein [Streptomyces longisporoflavus]|uniref:hypothetical protein n=1 Tax=Streptomyces longisporoflavus TaxID=28044 RepID=UPI00167CB859|nr:hypothetical protein [Streptomyces longisporoflavus]